MGDSDEEYDNKIRDKFRKERDRPDSYKDNRRDDRRNPRDDWMERDGWSGRPRGRGDYRQMMRDRHSPIRHDSGPSIKRMRHDWDDRGRFFEPSNYYTPWLPSDSQPTVTTSRVPVLPTPAPTIPAAVPVSDSNIESQPPMMSLKTFINTLDDSINDEDALKKYNEYKLDFRKQQINEFFVTHKEEEWFKEKYHPIVSAKRKEEHLQNVKKRSEVFIQLLNSSRFDNVLVDAENTDPLIKIMDMFVILLEGGNEFDFNVLDNDVEVVNKPTLNNTKLEMQIIGKKIIESQEKKIKQEKQTDIDHEINDQTVTTTQVDDKSEKDKEDNVIKEEPPFNTSEDDVDMKNGEAKALEEECPKDTDQSNDINRPGNATEIQTPRELHKTNSIFLRNLAPTITREMVENTCKKFQGFLRVAMADSQPERRWHRRGWATFTRDTDIKTICWNLSNLREIELSPIINRDLTRRVRTVSPITINKRVVRNDIKLCANIIENLDKKFNLWMDPSENKEDYNLLTKNPVMKDVKTHLIEEAPAEEEELLGKNEPTEEADEQDLNVFKALDRMIFYLRLVHSVDYYNHCEYPGEDEMPNRCGIIHARTKSTVSKVSTDEVNDYCKTFQSKVSHLIEPLVLLSDEEVSKLGKKEQEAEVEKFISANTQELGPQKWLCPLSGKKFKGPEFVLKHIQNKHADKIEEVKLEVEYFNNYLKDPKRPHLAEHPSNKQPRSDGNNTTSTGTASHGLPPLHPSPYPYNYGGGMYPPGGFGRGMNYGFPRGGPGPRPGFAGRARGGMDHRPIITYRDLDAPKEPDEFL